MSPFLFPIWFPVDLEERGFTLHLQADFQNGIIRPGSGVEAFVSEIKDIQTIPRLYGHIYETYRDRPAFGTRQKDKSFKTHSYGELYEQGLALATALIDLGIERGQALGVIADNRYEWILTDYGIQLSGCASVPRGTDVTDGDITYILPHSDSVAVFVEDLKTLEKVKANESRLKNIKHYILMHPNETPPAGVYWIYDLVKKGEQLLKEGDTRAKERIQAIGPDDIFTIIYTSGTTGQPKGVKLVQSNMVSQIRNIPIELYPTDRALSILTVWHIFERMIEIACMAKGVCTYYTSVQTIRDDMITVKPTVMVSAPRLWESVYQRILKNVQSESPVKQKLFWAAYWLSANFKRSLRFLSFREVDLEGRNPVVSFFRALFEILSMVVLAVPYFLMDRIALSKIRARTGGALRGTISGGGALPGHIDMFFNNVGITVLEGYGLTETSPVLAVRTFERPIIGTVGPIWPETEVRIVGTEEHNMGQILYPDQHGKGFGKKGEIHVRGPQVMTGYYKNPEATDRVLVDGWFNTGDLGMMTFNNCLKIMGRSKETIVLSIGENVEPNPIENKLIESELIQQVMVTGQDKKYLIALIVPEQEALAAYGSSLTEIASSEEAKSILRAEVKKLVNEETGFKPFERIQDVLVLTKPFEVGDEFTNIYKLKRDVVTEKYSEQIEAVYARD